jgi:hypothetical protein
MSTVLESVWPGMSADEFAALESAMDAKVERRGELWWRQVRPCFYRPLLPFVELDAATTMLPGRARFGGAQFAVGAEAASNSHIDLLMFDEPQTYSLEMLSQSNRRHVRKAMQAFDVREITDEEELVTAGHAVYMSFFERTQYGYKSDRTDPAKFAKWARTLHRFRKVQILGAYRGEELESVSVSYVVERVAFTATFFSRSDALKEYVADLMLHAIRERAAASENVTAIFGAFAGMERGLDDFYTRRGARLVRKPAVLKLNSMLFTFLKTFKRNSLRKFGL